MRMLNAAGKWVTACVTNLCTSPCTDVVTTPTPLCPVCSSPGSTTPRQVRVTVVGVQTLCHRIGALAFDWSGTLLSGTWTLTYSGSCRWDFTDTTQTVRRFNFLGETGIGNNTCNSASTGTDNPTISVIIGANLQVVIGQQFVSATTTFVNGQKTYTFANNTTLGSTGGTITVVFCP